VTGFLVFSIAFHVVFVKFSVGLIFPVTLIGVTNVSAASILSQLSANDTD
jgi:hypothetical protein